MIYLVMIANIVIGTRKSALALAQSKIVCALLKKTYPQIEITLKEIITKGDATLNVSLPSIGGKGLFTAELESSLLDRSIDIAVHSLKDLPTDLGSEFNIGAILEREAYADVLVSKDNLTLQSLPKNCIVGTSSPRRALQIHRLRSDLILKDIRGNVDTRIKKVRDGEYSATVLAEAGINRLSLRHEIAQVLTDAEMLPAPGQGAIAVQCLKNRQDLAIILKVIDSDSTRLCVTAERSLLHELEAGCSAPVAALGTLSSDVLNLNCRCRGVTACIEVSDKISLGSDRISSAILLGKKVAKLAVDAGFVVELPRKG